MAGAIDLRDWQFRRDVERLHQRSRARLLRTFLGEQLGQAQRCALDAHVEPGPALLARLMLHRDLETGLRGERVDQRPVYDVADDKQRRQATLEVVLGDECLENANLEGADLTDADLWRAKLAGANLKNAKLGGADLKEASLRNADLTGAQTKQANFAGADVLGGRSKRTFAACGEDDVVAAFDQRTAASLSDTAAAAGDDGVAQL